MKFHTILLNSTICFLLSLSTVEGGVISLSGDIETLVPPFSVQEGAVESDTVVRLILERENFVLPSNLDVDITTSGVFDEAIEITPGSISAGTLVNSYLLHADAPNSGIFDLFEGSIVFEQQILGVIITETNLQASHSIVGSPLTTYPVNGSDDAARAALSLGIFGEELTMILPDTLEFALAAHESNPRKIYDHVRVITAVPEPSSLALCSIAALSLALGYRASSRRRTDQPA